MISQMIFLVLATIVPVAAAAIAGQLATLPNLKPWYESLKKPSFNPPNWLFGPAWVLLYLLMAIAVWRILRAPDGTPMRSLALTLFFLQLALNAAWPWLFFARKNMLAGLMEIVPQWLLILATIALFAQIDAVAALCLAPLAAWVGFAGLLNFSFWRLNG